MLQEYAASPAAAWRSKDCAVYLVVALAVRCRMCSALCAYRDVMAGTHPICPGHGHRGSGTPLCGIRHIWDRLCVWMVCVMVMANVLPFTCSPRSAGRISVARSMLPMGTAHLRARTHRIEHWMCYTLHRYGGGLRRKVPPPPTTWSTSRTSTASTFCQTCRHPTCKRCGAACIGFYEDIQDIF